MIETVNSKQSVGGFIRWITLTGNSYWHKREIKSCSKYFIYSKNVADDLDGFTFQIGLLLFLKKGNFLVDPTARN